MQSRVQAVEIDLQKNGRYFAGLKYEVHRQEDWSTIASRSKDLTGVLVSLDGVLNHVDAISEFDPAIADTLRTKCSPMRGTLGTPVDVFKIRPLDEDLLQVRVYPKDAEYTPSVDEWVIGPILRAVLPAGACRESSKSTVSDSQIRRTVNAKFGKEHRMAKLGSSKHPAVVRVQTQERAGEILSICDEKGWKAIVGLEPDQPEDVSDVEKLLHPPAPMKKEARVGRNDPCPCGSGLKYKKCCGSR